MNTLRGDGLTGVRETLEELPLTEATFFILLSLSPKPKHGYAMMKGVESLSGGRICLSTGTLYGAIKRLLEKGWIRRVEDPIADENGRGRKAYMLTRYGKRILNAEVDRLQDLVETAQQVYAQG
jgi:DNA-binding PadR family transcriptional regulator